MEEILEFSEIKIPEKNPNHPNDIYKKNADGGVFFLLIGIVYTIICIGVLGVYICDIVLSREGNETWAILVLFGFMAFMGILWVRTNIKDMYEVYVYRKKMFENGIAYSGVITKVQPYTRRYSAARYGSFDLQEYVIWVKYADASLQVLGLETDPRKCLENPYCTVYVWKGKAIATDFKVKEEYIAPNGKTYLVAPRKKGKRK